MKGYRKMRKQIEFIAAILFIATVCILPVCGAEAASWNEAALSFAAQHTLLDDSETTESQGLLTRKQLALILQNCFGATTEADLADASDISPDDPYFSAMATAVQMGLFEENENGELMPDAIMTREEVFVILAQAFLLEPVEDDTVLANFNDAEQISDAAKPYIAALINDSYVNGMDGGVVPSANMTMEQIYHLVHKMAGTIGTDTLEKGSAVQGNLVLNQGDVTLSGITIEGDLIIAEGVDYVGLDNCVVKGRILIRGAGKSEEKEKQGLRTGVEISDTTVGETILVSNLTDTVAVHVTHSGSFVNTEETSFALYSDTVLSSNGITIQNAAISGQATVILNHIDVETCVILKEAAGSSVIVGADSVVQDMAVSAESVIIGGSGVLKTVTVSESYVNILTTDTTIVVSPDVVSVMAGDVTIQPGETYISSATTESEEPGDSVEGSGTLSSPTDTTTDSADTSDSTEPAPSVDLSDLYALESYYEGLLASLFNDVKARYDGTNYAALYNEVIANITQYEAECDLRLDQIVSGIEDSNLVSEIYSYYYERKSTVRSHYMQFLPSA